MSSDPELDGLVQAYVPQSPSAWRRARRRTPLLVGAVLTVCVAVVGVVLASRQGSAPAASHPNPASHDSASASPALISTSPISPSGRTVTETSAPAGASVGPLIAGTYLINRDIPVGRYRAGHDDASCAWAVVHGNGQLVLAHGGGGPIAITLVGTDKSLQVQGDCDFVRAR